MKVTTVFCALVTGAISYSITTVRFHSPPRTPKIARVVDYPPTSLRTESSYGQGQLLEKQKAHRVLRKEIPATRVNPNTRSSYSFNFGSGNGIKSQESGTMKQVPVTRVITDSYGETRTEESVEAVPTKSGETSWCSPEGLRFTLTYTADETGYHPTLTKGVCETSDVNSPQASAYGQSHPRNTYY